MFYACGPVRGVNRVTPRLTFNFGLRYDYTAPLVNELGSSGFIWESGKYFWNLKNPVTGAEVHPRAILPEGFVFKDAFLGKSSVFRLNSPVSYDHSGKYAASRPLFIYVKKAHVGVIPGINEFIAEYTSEKALGEDGYLSEKGLIPPTKGEIEKIRADAKSLKALKL